MFSDVPILGDLLTGPNREGVFAWNFGVQGGLENPQITVNPFSGFAPGFTREVFPIMPEEPPPPPRKGGKRSDAGATRLELAGDPSRRARQPVPLPPIATAGSRSRRRREVAAAPNSEAAARALQSRAGHCLRRAHHHLRR